MLHLVDSVQAYELARRDTKAIWKRPPTPLSADDLAKVQDLLESLAAPSGIAGTTRSILTYSLILILGIAVFHLLALPPSDKTLANSYAEYADKILILIAGSLTTAVGFYFGTKATTEGVAAGKPQQVDTPSIPSGHIDQVEPSHAASGATVVIQGTGFGQDQGNVEFDNVGVGTIANWSQTYITVIVPTHPQELSPGTKVDVRVNPAHGNKIVGQALFTVDRAAA